MTLKEFLEKHKIVAPAYLAGEMFESVYAKQILNNKLKHRQGQRILKSDAKKAVEILKELASDIKKIEVKDDFIE